MRRLWRCGSSASTRPSHRGFLLTDFDVRTTAAREPILNLPPAVAGLVLVNVAVHLLRLLLPDGLDWTLVITAGFVPARYTLLDPLAWPAIVAPVTHMFLHGHFLHLAINMATLMAFGTGLERRWGAARFLLFALLCGLIAAATHLAVYPTSPEPVIGASGAISGMFAGILLLLRRVRPGRSALRLWPIVAIFVAMNAVTAYVGLPGDGGASVAWVAHVGGFFGGLALFGPFDRARRGAERV